MNRTFGEHIRSLEEQRNALSAQLMNENNKAKRNQFERELRAVESALTLYRSALEIEARARRKSAAT